MKQKANKDTKELVADIFSGYTIENKTILLPNIIAEGAFWEALEESNIIADPEADYNLQLIIVPQLVDRANMHFKNNKLFRRQITSNEKGRDTLYAFMKHWTKSLLKNLPAQTNLINL